MGTFLLICAFAAVAAVAILKFTAKIQNDRQMANLGEPTLKIADLLVSGDPRFEVKAESHQYHSLYGLAQVVVEYERRGTVFYQTFDYQHRCIGDMSWLNEDEVEYLHTIAYRILLDREKAEQAVRDAKTKAFHDTARQQMIESLKK